MFNATFAMLNHADKTQAFLGAPGTVTAICGLLLGVADLGISATDIATGSTNPASDAVGGIDIAADAAQFYVIKLQLQAQMNLALCDGDMEESLLALYTALTILCLTLDVLTLSEQLNGVGPPDEGRKFTEGKSEFDDTHETVTRACPDPSQWSGAAADRYQKQNQEHSENLTSMADADALIAHILRRQAGQVAQAREGLAGTRAGLSAISLVLVTSALAKYDKLPEELVGVRKADDPVIGESSAAAHDPNNPFAVGYNSGSAAIKGFAYAIMILCFFAATSMIVLLGLLMDHGSTNARHILDAIDDYYAKVTANAKALIAPSAALSTNKVSTTTWASATFGSVSGVKAPSLISNTSRRSGSAGMDSVWADRRIPMGTLAGDDRNPQKGAATKPEKSTFTLPALPSWQAAKLSGPVSGQATPNSHPAGQVQQHVAVSQQETAAPAEGFVPMSEIAAPALPGNNATETDTFAVRTGGAEARY